MIIALDNATSSHPVDQPITGVIKVHYSEPFEASELKLELYGIQTSSYFEEVTEVANAASAVMPSD